MFIIARRQRRQLALELIGVSAQARRAVGEIIGHFATARVVDGAHRLGGAAQRLSDLLRRAQFAAAEIDPLHRRACLTHGRFEGIIIVDRLLALASRPGQFLLVTEACLAIIQTR